MARKKIVYVVTFWYGDDVSLIGVFSTVEKAREAKKVYAGYTTTVEVVAVDKIRIEDAWPMLDALQGIVV